MIDTFEEEFWIIPKDSHPKSISLQTFFIFSVISLFLF